ncbi:SRPBCC domain-containing protein [Micromonospora noduli]|uniref:SRPBCC domain-containing protein n=1 Tax=Micromonospora noduli TaxID=709876 RepID=UPI000DBF458B|nr:SRPBCC domain-containing protein [Micromonospora noduli]RAO10595.1 Peroxidase [Micromonospora noduli]RAO16865.1 Peroxidase [Micromonospora noduli]RAO51027.1 Peroxidase [Micromonospora noduli]
MIEIGAQVDLSHPAERVWRALTDRELLGRWFAEAETVEGVADRMLLHTSGLPGFEANVEVEVTERQEPDLLVLACDEAGRLSELTCTVTTTKQGCRLELREVSTHGAWSAEQHEPREQQLRQALTVRLPAILDWLAFQQVDLSRADGGMTAELPLIGVRGRADRNPRRRRTLVAVVAGAVLVAGTAAWVTLPPDPKPAAAPAPTATASPTVTAGTVTVAPTATPSARPSRTTASATTSPSRTPSAKPSRTPASAAPPPPPPPAPVTARYETDSDRLFGYTGEIVVRNPGGAPVADWAVVVTLAEGTTVDDVDGANWRQDKQVITFTGAALAAGGSQTISFDVRDSRPKAREPESCTIGGQQCAGL